MMEERCTHSSSKTTILFDLITADVRLLPGDGLKAVEVICAERDIPVIFITGYADELRDRAPGATVIQKPISEEELAAAVQHVVAKRRLRC